jgi:hypothetical protein
MVFVQSGNYTTTDEPHNSSAKYQFSTKPDVSFAQNRVEGDYTVNISYPVQMVIPP